MKKELHEFTVDELLGEIKRRLKCGKKDEGYAYATGKVVEASSSPLYRRRYTVEFSEKERTEKKILCVRKDFRLLGGAFKLSTAPAVGDTVRLRTRLTKRTRAFSEYDAVIAGVVHGEGGMEWR